jgi:tetratricopeptide (TPR) repeat protein
MAVAPVEIGSVSGPEFEWVRLGLMDFIGNRIRENGPAVIPSDNVIALLHGHTVQELTPGHIQSILQVREVVHPVAIRSDNAWVVRLELRDKGGAIRTVEARDPDVIKAARGAADQVLDMKGIKIRPLAGKATDSDQAEWYQRIEAMVLRSEFDGARQMLMTASESQRSSFAAQLRLGRIELSAGNYAEARSIFEHLLNRGLAESEPLARAQAIAGLAEANQRFGLIDEASKQFSESIAVFDGLRESRDLGNAYVGRANTYFVQGRESFGAADLSSARVAFELAGDTLAIGRVDLSEGAQLMYAGMPEKALPFLRQAEQRFERFDALADLSIVLGNQIGVYLQLDRPADALQVAQVGTRLDALQNLVLKNAFKLRRASALAANGLLSDARKLLSEVMRGKDSPTLPLTSIANGMLAQLEFEAGRPDSANGLASQAVQGLSNSEFVSPRAAAWLVRTRALRNLSKTIESSQEVVAFSAWSASTGDVGAILLARVAVAEQFWSAGERKAAIEQYEIALDKSSLGRPPDDVVAVALSYGNSLIDGNDLQRASAVVGRIAPNADADFYCALLMVKLYRALKQSTAWQEALQKAVSLAGERDIPQSFAEALQPKVPTVSQEASR